MAARHNLTKRMQLKRLIAWIMVVQTIVLLLGIAAAMAVGSNASLLRAGGEVYRLRVADAEAERELGLSGVQSMSSAKGMLFVFDKPDAACFWMKDMQFAIDMIWLDADKRVIAVADEVAPRTYPRTYCPPSHASYVIELAAGQAEAAGIAPGQTLRF